MECTSIEPGRSGGAGTGEHGRAGAARQLDAQGGAGHGKVALEGAPDLAHLDAYDRVGGGVEVVGSLKDAARYERRAELVPAPREHLADQEPEQTDLPRGAAK